MPDLPVVSEDLLSRYDVVGPRYTSYPTVPAWNADLTPSRYAQVLADTDPAAPVAVYVHIPFCRSMCAYCGCNVVISKKPERADRYLDTLEKELALVGAALGGRRSVKVLHLGGGTPTFLSIAQLERLDAMLHRHFHFLADAEKAVEINPVTATFDQLAALAGLGFNRLSMGVQDLDEGVQAAIRRYQSVEATQRLMDFARGVGFRSINLDLIYGLPRQTVRSWARTLEAVRRLQPDRLAVYSFAFLPQLRPNQRVLDGEAMPGGINKVDLFRQAYTAFTGAGYVPIGMDHFAAPHDGLAKAAREGRLWRNFQGYTPHRDLPTIAVGSSAISDIGGVYAQNHRRLGDWRAAVEAGELPVARGAILSAEDRARRTVINDLMCNLEAQVDARYPAEILALRPMVTDGLVEFDGRRIHVNEGGRLFLRNVAMPFDEYLQAPNSAAPRFSRTV
jgi:oxygen-independent coproporphyrinogen-3 oxidase